MALRTSSMVKGRFCSCLLWVLGPEVPETYFMLPQLIIGSEEYKFGGRYMNLTCNTC